MVMVKHRTLQPPLMRALLRALLRAQLRTQLRMQLLSLLRFTALIGLVAGSALTSLHASAAGHDAVSADTAAQALAHGATVVDVRSATAFAQGRLPGAVHLPHHSAAQPVAVLERLVSAAGVDLSRTVLVVGEPGDANAQALWTTLSAYATGRVLWLVGGVVEWQLRSYALGTQTALAPAVPQHLVRLQPEPAQVRMAGQALRASLLPDSSISLNLNVQ
jgi:rhodanese-related sulfurtransferase